ncbi:TIGR03619 family F420-dependent LLM class oxidoreductase [Mycobacterium sp. CVI_P3]|uniref:TIGR03619 family F420-dependent LLM class oxidoreductase n=1 Tax=Mycobacterium pinniadriaticum TaxID=2994102 RepID=A0ABT3SGW0_9MYCO|nr:TIGR03619 family F420-dependent LLM class oxidoreductase [Mycobacterium pinniadriaticum]MCX2931803.1 TIGR03619 family F420-dependent LLM class oxidoreductase [Mycobacterium pinniadriaticum]MCX2938122.1 TIGR03619 family F420-dependent LLM class oxidoreductase [Mycobacterium pinniadriaticum]
MSFAGRLGLVFPQDAIGGSQAAICDFAQDAQACGFDYLAAAHHDLGLDRDLHGDTLRRDWPFPETSSMRSAPYSAGDAFHEPFVLFGYLSGVCELSFLSAALVLPQRQTVAVAKAAAEVDLLSGGRLTLGVGAGWNSTEMTMTGMPWSNRFARMEEQIHLLRELWTSPNVSFNGQHHRLAGASIRPRPVQQPIPIWIGSGSGPHSIDRVARLADGWMPQQIPGQELDDALREIRHLMERSQRDPDSLDLHGVITVGDADIGCVARRAARWAKAGATYLALDLRGSLPRHRNTLHRFVDAVRSS